MVLNFLRSRRAFYAIVLLFVFESLWIALTARYPMAFDEFFHFGVTQLHTQTWLPFLANVPDSASQFGAITRDPSFLYHYLLSFPLRLLQLITSNEVWQILILRILNIGLATASLFVYSRLIRRLGVSQLVTNVILLFFILIPVIPLMAGQITYDNLFFLMTAVVMLLAVGFVQQHQQQKTFNITKLHWLLLAGLFTCFIKYAFIPALLAIVIYIFVLAARQRQTFIDAYKHWWRTAVWWHKTATVLALVIGLWFFAGSYGLNVVRYHTPLPDCDAVLNVEACSDYGPWRRDHRAKLAGGAGTVEQLPWYVGRWTRQMMMETFFMVGAKFDESGWVNYYSTRPITIMFITAWTLFIAGMAILIWRIKWVWRQPALRLILLIVGVYTLALFARNLQFFMETGGAVAIHGRYLLPFIPPLIAVIVLAARQAPWPLRISRKAKLWILSITLLLFLQGGGLISYIVSTNDDWMWPQSQVARDVTHQARELISPLIYRR